MTNKKTIAVIGLGLIGGSMAKDLRAKGNHLLGYDNDQNHLNMAKQLQIIDEQSSIDQICKKANIIIIAVPVIAAPSITKLILDSIEGHQVVCDVGSTKRSICNAVATHPNRQRFVACHPLAGTEYSGPEAALSGLFQNKKNIICDEHLSAPDALEQIIELITSLGMQSLFMSSPMHDQHMAYVSHLSHVSSFMLGNTVLDIEEDEKQIFNLASTGFESTVRLAKSSPNTWTDIFIDNKDNIRTALDAYILHLQNIKSLIESEKSQELKAVLHRSNDLKRVLNGMKYNIVKIS